MKITVCGSMKFANEMWKVAKKLEKLGHKVYLPEGVREHIEGKLDFVPGTLNGEEGAERKKKHNLIRKHYQKIKDSDAILVVNLNKKGAKNYIGANSFLEMGFAYVLRKRIFLLYPIPEFDFYREEILAMEPIIIRGNLN